MNIKTSTIEIRAKAKAFSHEGVREHSFMVDRDTETVRVWDDVAGHFTTCHSLSPKAVRRIRKIAEEEHRKHRLS
jgi:hypothetical protein